ncbi:MAG: MBL fold metallo-hydrolase, partial [Acidobacteriota bacterium]
AATRDALVRLRAPHATHLGALRLAELSPGIVALPQPTPTLAPATHTNAILAGREHAVLIDPGATTWPDIQILLRALEAARDVHGRTLSAIWLTHHHDDHIGAAETVRSRFGVPICAHEDAARKLAGIGLRVDQTLDDGQQVTVSTDPLLTLEVLHTPGHAPGHCCFFDADRRVLLAGDLVSTLSTIVVVPPDGDMDAYLASLEKAAAREPILLIPAHGGPTLDGASRLRKTYAHRLWRESRIVEAWKNGHRTPDALVAVVYDDVPTRAHPIARRQLDAHLVRLRRSGAIDDAPV